MLHFNSLLSVKLCADEHPGKKQKFKRCFRLLLHITNYTCIVPESKLPVFLISKALCEKLSDKCLVLTSHTKAFTISPKSISVGFVVIVIRLPHLAMSQKLENLATRKNNSLLYNALCN